MAECLASGGPDRRQVLLAAGAGLGGALLGLAGCAQAGAPMVLPPPGPAGPLPADDGALLDDLEQRTFAFFRDTTSPVNGLAPDRWPRQSFASIAAVGFALSAHVIGAEQGWIPRAAARTLALNTLRFFRDAPQGPGARGVAGYRGFFYHFLDMASGERFGTCELSTVDTALLLMGVLHVAEYFNTDQAGEAEIRRAAETISERVDWRWAQHRPPSICHGWSPEGGFIPNDWKGYNEAMLVYLLALGSPRQPVAPAAWSAWTSTYERSWSTFHGHTHLHFAPLFGHQYTHCWVDFRGIHDAYMRARGFDYFENSRRAALAQRAYAQANPLGWRGYGGDIWGITACDGPADVVRPYRGEPRRFISYAGRGVGGHDSWDDGTLAPTAALASLPFAPEIVLPALRALRQQYGHAIYAHYGFIDSFNPSFDFADVQLKHGRLVSGLGWVDTDHLGIDQGPITLMAANHRRDQVWRMMRGNAQLRRGLLQAGFSGGWL
jgi:hypothetical protein